MPLIDLNETVVEEIDGDSYTLRRQIGFFEASQIKSASLKVRTVEVRDENGRGRQKPLEVVSDLAAGSIAKLQAWLVAWSYDEPLIEENIKRLHPKHGDRLLDRIKELEAAQPQPFRGQPGSEG